ncbi:hypothetical protein M1563_02400 [Patescibacteria group bacterium]|nr:hypothetical protein [Patescibacteria group bacterium]MCL5409294.1 hypothetical protein [Patescibacteria group bacterium]
MPFARLYDRYHVYYRYLVLAAWFFYLFSPLFFVLRIFIHSYPENFLPFYKEIFSIVTNNPSYIALPFIILFIGMIYFYPKHGANKDKIIFKIILLSALISQLSITYLENIELSHYPNYLFSTTGLPIDILITKNKLDVYLIIFIFLLIKTRQFKHLSSRTKKYLVQINWLNYSQIVTAIIIISGLALHLITIPKEIFYFRQDYNYKNRNYGSEYFYIQALVNSVPKYSNVILPPKVYDWPLLSNHLVVRYFLFPRTLISGNYLKLNITRKQFNTAYFVESNSFRTQQPWPKINNQDKVIFFDYKDPISYQQLDTIADLGTAKIYKIIF